MKNLLLGCLLIIFCFGTSFSAEIPLAYYTFEHTSKVLENEVFLEVRQYIDEALFFEDMSKDAGDEICTNITEIIRKYSEQSKIIIYRDPKVVLFGVSNGAKKVPTFIILNMGFVLYDPVYAESYSLDIVRLFSLKLRKVKET
jgi:hypothetical protein